MNTINDRESLSRGIDRSQVVEAFRELVVKFEAGDPAALPDCEEAESANQLFQMFRTQEELRLSALDDPEQRLEYDFALTTLFVDAGFQDPNYIGEVANDWLIQTLDSAEDAGFTDLATRIKVKIFELNKTLPEEMWLPSTRLGIALEDLLESEDCAELATTDTIEEALGYAFTLLIENGVEDPEALLVNRGILE